MTIHPTGIDSDTLCVKYFLRRPTLEEWRRFLVHCGRVHILNFDVWKSWRVISSDALNAIAYTRPTGSLFTNLQVLRANCPDKWLGPMFMSSSVTELAFSITKQPSHPEEIAWAIDEFVANMANIASLKIESSILSPPDTEPYILRLLEAYPLLTVLYVPCMALLPSIVEAASRLPKLRVLWNELGRDTVYDSSDPITFPPTLDGQSFPSLEKLSFTAHVREAVQLLQNPHFPPPSLSSLCFRAIIDTHNASNNSLRPFLQALDEKSKSIQELDIHMQTTVGEGLRRVTIIFPDIAPLLALSNLTRLYLHNDEPIQMTDDEAQQLAAGLPRLIHLDLTRGSSQPPTLTLRCLAHFALHCHELTRLELSLNARDDVPSAHDAISFRHLRFLHLGSSPISDPQPVIRFFARSLPTKCLLLVLQDDIIDDAAVYRPSTGDDLDRCWKEVQNTLSQVLESTQRWIDVERSLRNENEKLRRENERLMEALASRTLVERALMSRQESMEI